MSTVTVYRVEQPDGSGPYFYPDGDYRWFDSLERMREDHSDTDHPTPSRDGLPVIESHQRSGFVSLVDLKNWFRGWEPSLAAEDYSITLYDVPEKYIGRGGKQAIFHYKKAKYVRSLSLLDIDARKVQDV